MTRNLIILAVGLGLSLSADEKGQPAKKPAAENAAAPKTSPGPLKLPADAVLTAPETWRYKDKQGKEWTYRLTPFGLTRFEEKAGPAASAGGESPKPPADSLETSAVEDGDTIRFERPGPFGIYRWERKKSDLNEWEQSVWNRVRQKQEAASPRQAANPATTKSKPE